MRILFFRHPTQKNNRACLGESGYEPAGNDGGTLTYIFEA
jgi:hypothetical protein